VRLRSQEQEGIQTRTSAEDFFPDAARRGGGSITLSNTLTVLNASKEQKME
jgi:hypothetical protein